MLSARRNNDASIRSAMQIYGVVTVKRLPGEGINAYKSTAFAPDSSSANRSYLIRKQKELDKDGELIANRVSKLKQIEKKMLRKIDLTRQEAEKVLKSKEKNNERVQEKIKILAEQQGVLDKRRETIRREKLFHKEKLKQANDSKHAKAYQIAREARELSLEARRERLDHHIMRVELNKVQASIISD